MASRLHSFRFIHCALLLLGLMPAVGLAAQITVSGGIYGDADGTLIDTSMTQSESGTPLAVPEVNIGETASANGYTFTYEASSNIQTGSLKVFTSAISDPGSSGSAGSTSLGMPQVLAHLEDDLVFTPSNSDPYDVTLSMFITGSLVLDPSTTYFSLAEVLLNPGPGQTVLDAEPLTPGGSVNELRQVSLTLSGVSSVYVFAALESYIYSIDGGGKQSIADLSHTAQLAITLPEGVTMTSASGLFLTAVPEPDAWLLMAIGVLVLGFYLRRKVT
jgi:hypothetical protein